MSSAGDAKKRHPALYIALVLVLIICLWAGWSDVKPQLSQDEIREGIRLKIRQTIQFIVQYALPVAILGFLAREAHGWFRSKSAKQDSDSP